MGCKRVGAISAICACVLLSACATKNYGRQGELTGYERNALTCREIDMETAKVHGYLSHVEKESEFDGRSVLSFLGDFGIGNVMEKSSAMDAANTRLAQLQDLRVQKGCTATASQTPSATTVTSQQQPTYAPAPATAIATPKIGQFSNRVEALPEVKACNAHAIAGILGKGPGYENYSVQCTDGNTVLARCEFGNCRVLK